MKTKWKVAHIGQDTAVYQEIVSKFQKIYEAAGKPNGAALFELHDLPSTSRRVHALCLNPIAVEYCAELFEGKFIWEDTTLKIPKRFIAGDCGQYN